MAPRKLTIDDYEITRDGKVINKHTRHTLAPQPNGKGYLRVSIGKKLMFIHRLVAEKYIPNPENKPQVNHKDGNKLNNCVDNLEWVTNQENRNHTVDNDLQVTGERCSWAKLTEENVKEIRANPGYENEYWARKFKVSRSTINDVVNYRTWKHID